MTEAELALKFIDHLKGFEIYKEVPARGIIDIVAVLGNIRIGVEVKVALNFDVIWQAYQSRSCCHYSYAAVPVKSRYGSLHPAQVALCKHLGIGVMGYQDGKVKEYVRPQLNRTPCQLKLHDYMKRSEAGSQNNRITAFGYFVECIETIVKKHPNGIEPKALFTALEFKHYRTLSVFKSSVVKYCNKGVIKTIDWDGDKFSFIKVENESTGRKRK